MWALAQVLPDILNAFCLSAECCLNGLVAVGASTSFRKWKLSEIIPLQYKITFNIYYSTSFHKSQHYQKYIRQSKDRTFLWQYRRTFHLTLPLLVSILFLWNHLYTEL
jgi:hypothetical protein